MERIFFALFHGCTPLALTLTRRQESGRGIKRGLGGEFRKGGSPNVGSV